MPTDSSSSRSSATRCSADRPAEAEHLAVTAHQLHPLVGVHPAQRVRVAAEQPNSGVARQIPGRLEVDLAVGEQRVDLLGGHVDLGHPGPARGDDVLRAVFVGGQADRAGLDAQRNILAHQRDSLAFGSEVGRTGQDAGVVGIGTEPGGQHLRVAVVELDMQRAALGPHGNGLIQPAVFESQIVEHAQRLAREPAEFVMVAFGLQLADHHQRNDDFVLGEPVARPRIGQQNRCIEHIGPDVREADGESVTGRSSTNAAPRRNFSGRSGIRTGAGPAVIATGDTARIAKQFASHRLRRYPRAAIPAGQARRPVFVTGR